MTYSNLWAPETVGWFVPTLPAVTVCTHCTYGNSPVSMRTAVMSFESWLAAVRSWHNFFTRSSGWPAASHSCGGSAAAASRMAPVATTRVIRMSDGRAIAAQNWNVGRRVSEGGKVGWTQLFGEWGGRQTLLRAIRVIWHSSRDGGAKMGGPGDRVVFIWLKAQMIITQSPTLPSPHSLTTLSGGL